MSELFTRVKEIPTPEVVRAFFSTVELRRDGSGREKALCPLHVEDTLSFTVFEDGFKCFGCGELASVRLWFFDFVAFSGSFRVAQNVFS